MKSFFCKALFFSAVALFTYTGCGGRYSVSTERNAIPEASNASTIHVFGWASTNSEDKELEAQIRAKQCLLLTRGAGLEMGGNGLSVKNDAHFVGLKFSPLRLVNEYVVTELTTGVAAAVPLGYELIGKTVQTVPLDTFFISVAEAAQLGLEEQQQELRHGTKGFLVLKSMELVPENKAVNCRYDLEVYAEK